MGIVRTVAAWCVGATLAGAVAPAHLACQGIGLTGRGAKIANLGGTLIASNFSEWTVASGTNGPLSWSDPSVCVSVTSGGATFSPFVAGRRIRIVDTGTPSLSETVTVTGVTVGGGGGCSIAVTPNNPHFGFYLTSATAGLQEAISYARCTPAVVSLTPDWAALGGTTAMITAASGCAPVTIADNRTAVAASYTWAAGSYVLVPNGASGLALTQTTLQKLPFISGTGTLTPSQVTVDATGTNVSGISQLLQQTSFSSRNDIPAYQNFSSLNGYFDDFTYNGKYCNTVSGLTTPRTVYGITGQFGAGSVSCDQTVQTAFGPGISYNGIWDTFTGINLNQIISRRGIANALQVYARYQREGDANFKNMYAAADGGTHTPSDEGIVVDRNYSGQIGGSFQGSIVSTSGMGDQDPVLTMTPYAGPGCAAVWPLGGAQCFLPYGAPAGTPLQPNTGATSDGLDLVLTSAPVFTGRITGMSVPLVSVDTNGGLSTVITGVQVLPVTGGALPVISAMCTNQSGSEPSSSAGAQGYVHRTYTCNLQTVTLPGGGTWTSPPLTANPGQFVCKASGYPEQMAVVSVTPVVNGAQQITLNIRSGTGVGDLFIENSINGCMNLSYLGQIKSTGIRSSLYAYGSLDGVNVLAGYRNFGSLRPNAIPVDGFDSEVVAYPVSLSSVSRDNTGYVTGMIAWPFLASMNQSILASIVGCADTSFNGPVPLFSVDSFNSYYPNPAHWTSPLTTAATTTGCSVAITGYDGVTLNRYAQIIYNKADGAFPHLETNTVNWPVGGIVENPHASAVEVSGERSSYNIDSAPNTTASSYGKSIYFIGNWGGNAIGFTYVNASRLNSYIGRGGVEFAPTFEAIDGDWGKVFTFDTPPIEAMFDISYRPGNAPWNFIQGAYGTWTVAPGYTDHAGIVHKPAWSYRGVDMGLAGNFYANTYSNLPVATTTAGGVVKVGSGISVSSDGTISVPAATGTSGFSGTLHLSNAAGGTCVLTYGNGVLTTAAGCS